MTEEEGTGRAPSAAPPENLEALTEEIERTREELGETVEALVAKADVSARTREKAAEVAGRVSGKASQVKEAASQVKEQAAARLGSAGAAAPEPVRLAAKQAASRAQQRHVLVAVAVGGALLAGWLIVRGRRR
jgi:succinyl-CoA synthetase beta subunit